jgi:hypothetical protein
MIIKYLFQINCFVAEVSIQRQRGILIENKPVGVSFDSYQSQD